MGAHVRSEVTPAGPHNKCIFLLNTAERGRLHPGHDDTSDTTTTLNHHNRHVTRINLLTPAVKHHHHPKPLKIKTQLESTQLIRLPQPLVLEQKQSRSPFHPLAATAGRAAQKQQPKHTDRLQHIDRHARSPPVEHDVEGNQVPPLRGRGIPRKALLRPKVLS